MPGLKKPKVKMGFVERERLGSISACERMLATAAAIYRRACAHDGIPETTALTVFSEGNPFVSYYEKALNQFREMATSVAAMGYEGLSLNSRELPKVPAFRKNGQAAQKSKRGKKSPKLYS